MTISIKKVVSRGQALFTVGVIDQMGWEPLMDCGSRHEAMAWLSYLNGGVHPNETEGYWNKSDWAERDIEASK